MSRNILPSAIQYLATTDKVRIAHLVILELPGSTPESPAFDYLTDYGSEIVSGGKAYSPDRVIKVGDVRQGTKLTNYKLSIDIAGEYQEELDRALNENKQTSFVGKTLRVLRAYLDEEGNVIPFDKNTNGPMEYFFGVVDTIAIADGVVKGNSTVSWQCAGKFADFNIINGRITDDATHRGLESATNTAELLPGTGAKKEAYKTDTGFQHANQTISLVSKYTTKETRYKMKSSLFGLKSKLKEYEVEVVKELELGVDLAAKYLPFIRGVRRVPGIPIFLDNLASDPSKLYIVYAICEGPASLLNLYIDGESALCLDAGQQETNMCLGNVKAGDTLSKFLRKDSGYKRVHDSYSPKRNPNITYEVEDLPYIPTSPILPQNNLARATKGIDKVSTFTITNSTGVKRFTYYPGHSNQTADPGLKGLAASRSFFIQREQGKGPEYWDDNCKLLDTAYLILQMDVSEEEQEIPELEMVMESHSFSGAEELVSLNPADHLQDYLSSSTFGGSLPLTDIDVESFDYVRGVYNTPLTSYNKDWVEYWRYLGWRDNTTYVPKLLECNTVITTEETVTKNVESLLSQMDATINQLGGKYHLSIEDDSPAIADIHVDEVQGSVAVKDTSGNGKWNSISANLIDPALDWSSNKLVFFDSNYLTQDKEVQKKGTIAFNYITNYYTARNWARRQLDKSRFSREITIKTYYKYVYLYPNANVTFTYPRFGWDKKKLRVSRMTMLADGHVNLTLQDTDNSIYQDIIDSEVVIPPLPPAGIPRPSNLRVLDATDPNYPFPTDVKDVYGYLLWEPFEGTNLLRYEVEDWNRPNEYWYNLAVPANRIINHSVTGKPSVFYPLTKIELNKAYMFKVRTLDRFGNYSKYALIEKTFDNSNLPSDYSPVTNFVTNNTNPSGEYTGSTVTFSWDKHPSVEVTSYILEILEPQSLSVLGSVSLTSEEYEFSLANNMQMYSNKNSGSIGAYRDFTARIKAVAINASSPWTYLN